MAKKDRWNSVGPAGDSAFNQYVLQPELAGLIPILYPGVFPNLAAYSTPRADLQAILHTGIPDGIIGGFQNFTGPTQADMLRLNVAIPPPRRTRTSWASWAATWPGSPTVAACSTTCSPSSCGPSPAPPSRWWTRPSPRTGRLAVVTDGVTPPGNVTYRSVLPVPGHAQVGLLRDAGGVIP